MASPYGVSEVTQQIYERFGEYRALQYQNNKKAFTFYEWKQKGYSVKRGQKAIKQRVVIEVGEDKVLHKTLNLFCSWQVVKTHKTIRV